jgi:multidrug efflux pump subunit AcrB
MTLGGMALAVGILVDDATVELENIHRNLGLKKPLVRAILDGAQQIAVPAFVSTACICIVFVPVAFISGAARSLFVPLALSVVLAMMTSYFLSRTLVPTMVHKLLAPEVEAHARGEHETGLLASVHARVERAFLWLQGQYGGMLAYVLLHRAAFVVGFVGVVTLSLGLFPFVGRDFFPSVDAGQIKLHVRARPGTRIEETEQLFGQVEKSIREVIPSEQIETMLDNIGTPVSGINLSLSDGSAISSADGEILVALKEGHSPTPAYVEALRRALKQRYPQLTFFFLAPDISTQVLNFGLSAPIDIQFVGPLGNQPENLKLARAMVAEVAKIPGAVDVHLQQVPGVPAIKLDVDRTRASQLGLTQRDVASDVLVSLSSSGQTAPNYWLDRAKGVQYTVAVQTPQRRVDSLDALSATPLTGLFSGQQQQLSNVAQVSHGTGPANITHMNAMQTYDVLASVEGTDLGSVAASVDRLVAQLHDKLPRGTRVSVRGQVESMQSSFRGLGYGLIFAVVLVYLLMAVNFQSWLDPLIILMALPGAMAGIAWMLWVSQTTLSVPALMGAIMCIGVATANSILLVTFANDQRSIGRDAHDAALAAGVTRLRPVVMTALAMVLGMLPMALGFGEGGEQNAPLGRAVVGGLSMATLATLFFVPVMYSLLRTKPPRTTDFLEA